MSGPKVDYYELEQQRRLALATARLNRTIDYIAAQRCWHDFREEVRRQLKRLEGGGEDAPDGERQSPELCRLREELEQERRRLADDCRAILREELAPFTDEEESENQVSAQAERLREDVRRRSGEMAARDRAYWEHAAVKLRQIGLLETREQLETEVRKILELCRSTLDAQREHPDMVECGRAIRSVADGLRLRTEELLNAPLPASVPELDALSAATVSAVRDALEAAEDDLRQPLERFRAFTGRQQELGSLLSAFQDAVKASDGCAACAIRSLETSPLRKREFYAQLEETARERLEETLGDLEALIGDESVTAEDQALLTRLYEDILRAAEDRRASLAAEIGQATTVMGQVRLRREEFERAYRYYYAQRTMLNYLRAKEGRAEYPLTERWQFTALEDLTAGAAEVEALLACESEQNYIRQQIDQVMREHGYDTVREMVLQEGQRGQCLLSRKKGGDTAINIVLTKDAANRSRMVMEIVGVRAQTVEKAAMERRNGERILAPELSAGRKAELVREQGSFCTLFPKLVAELEARGVRMTGISRSAPREDFCKEIVVYEAERPAAGQSAALRRERREVAARALSGRGSGR